MHAITFHLPDGSTLKVLAATTVTAEAESLAENLAGDGTSWTIAAAPSPFATAA